MENEGKVYGAMPRIGAKAPDFEAMTTAGRIKFSTYNKDSWVIMFSHPADFTPVCTTELSQFALEKEFFTKHNTRLLGLSIDSVHSHLAWVQNVKKNLGVYMDFPIIADLDMKVAQQYGMLHPDESETAAVRAVFFIDPAGIIRLILYYPLNVGRNMEEIKRVLVALQTADDCKCALPVNWKEGDKAIVPPPKTLVEVEERIGREDYEMIDFYLAKKEI
ncbi:peroxiredoxin [Fulvivirgaceae bacterium BMA12]|uniref:Peroxiredoxin n=1 Tax=Agaribacillus aureus TaxID=3051825 RepID=A0ABT8LJR7_9BACT|nr:peroxiredoxin [Fulvivirgaceae bacterium BMA12]